MRKNLFLTLALVLASFAGAIAQDAQNWAVTLGGAEGLPGETVTKDGANLKYYKSGIIRADKPIKSLRLTCAGNSTNNKPNGNNFRMMLSELNIYSADNLKEELAYTVTTNADHNTLTKSFDGQGLKALYDGKYNNYFASMSAEAGAVAEFHYVELTFEQEIQRFVIEWGGKQGAGEAPSVVGLTEGGVAFVEPYTDRASSFSEEKITTIAELEAAKYFTVRGNAATTYNTYYNNDNEGKLGQLNEENLKGSGPMYVTLGELYAAEPNIDYMTRLVPVGDGTYYIYFPMQKKYLNGNADDNQLNDAQNGWQFATADIAKAAKVTLTPVGNNDFEMSYVTKKGNDTYTVYVGADPRTGRMKIFSKVKKEALVANNWCEGFAIICAFNWSFYPADYQAPVWAKEYEVGNVYIAIKNLQDVVEDDGTMADVVTALEETMQNIDDMEESDIEEAIAAAKEEMSSFIYDIAETEYSEMESQWDNWKRNSKEEFNSAFYPMSAYKQYIEPGETLILGIMDVDDTFVYIEEITNYFANKKANLKAFEASHNKYRVTLPLEYTNLAQDSTVIEVVLDNAVKGFRWTLMENHSGNKNQAGYYFTSFAELEVYNNTTGEKVALTEQLITSNSNQGGEGTIAGLVDGIKVKGEETNNNWYWHSIWGGGAHNPDGNAYLDIKFPDGIELSHFTIKGYTRAGQGHNAPKTVIISHYAKSYDAKDDVVNPYNAAIGALVTNPADLKDGGLYIIQGNLWVNRTDNPAEPRYYAGNTPVADANAEINETNIYMFKKVGDAWNILSLNEGKYWKAQEEGDYVALTTYKEEAAKVLFEKSQNLANKLVIYSEAKDTLSASYKWVNEEKTDSIEIDSTEVIVKARVFMDWQGALASRLCYSAQPGDVDPQFESKLTNKDFQTNNTSAGDYLHFNKTNGEGEWSIYEASMDDEYFLYLTALVNELENIKFTPGEHPGCILADSATSAAFKNAKAAAQVAVKKDKKNNAETLVANLIESIDALKNSERVGFDPEAVYRIESGLPKYKDLTWYTRSAYADEANGMFKWTVTPDNFEGENEKFLFNIIEVNEDNNAEFRLNVDEENFGKVFIIKLANKEKYAGAYSEEGNKFVISNIPAAYFINNLEARNFEINYVDEGKNNKYWHTAGHSEGKGYEGNIVQWNCNPNLYSASSWKFVNNALPDYEEVEEDYIDEDDDTSIEDLVIVGDEVVSVSYFTPAGTAIPAPVKGLNIVVTVYANGVIEAKKKLVK